MTSGLRNLKGATLASESAHSYALLIIAAGVVIAILYWARAVFITSLFAVITAFLLEPFVGLLARARCPRPLATFIVCFFALMGIYLTGLAFWNQVSGIAREAPNFESNLTAEITALSARLQNMGDSATRILGGGSGGPSGVTGSTGPKAPARGPSVTPKTTKKALDRCRGSCCARSHPGSPHP